MGQVKKMETIKANTEFISATETKATEKVKSADTIDFDAYNTVDVESMSVKPSGDIKYASDFIDIDFENADITAIPTLWNLSPEQIDVLVDTLINSPGKYQIAYKNGRLAIKSFDVPHYGGSSEENIIVYDEHGKKREHISIVNDTDPKRLAMEVGVEATSYTEIFKYDEDGKSNHSQRIYGLENGCTYVQETINKTTYLKYYDKHGNLVGTHSSDNNKWIDPYGRVIDDPRDTH